MEVTSQLLRGDENVLVYRDGKSTQAGRDWSVVTVDGWIQLVLGVVVIRRRRESLTLLEIRFETLPGPSVITSGFGPAVIIFYGRTGIDHEVWAEQTVR